MLYLRSTVEVLDIGVEAVGECYKDAKQWLGSLVAKADCWMADYGDEPRD